MTPQTTANTLVELHRDAGDFKGLDEEATRLRAYDLIFPELSPSVGLRDAGKYVDVALETVMNIPRIVGHK